MLIKPEISVASQCLVAVFNALKSHKFLLPKPINSGRVLCCDLKTPNNWDSLIPCVWLQCALRIACVINRMLDVWLSPNETEHHQKINANTPPKCDAKHSFIYSHGLLTADDLRCIASVCTVFSVLELISFSTMCCCFFSPRPVLKQFVWFDGYFVNWFQRLNHTHA